MTTLSLRRGLLALFGIVLASVYWTLRRPHPPASAGSASGGGATGNRVGGLVYRKYKDGRENFLLKADKMSGSDQEVIHLEGVNATFRYFANGHEGTSTISSARCEYTQAEEKALFSGNVVVTSSDGFEVRSESLDYRGQKALARSEDRVEFRDGRLWGSALGVVYRSGEGTIELVSDAYVKIEDEKPGGPITEIHSETGELKRDEGTVRFSRNVRVQRGPDTLAAGEVLLIYNTESRTLLAASATDEVVLDRGPGAALPGMGGHPGGHKILKCAKLLMGFRPDKTPTDATAGGEAEFITLPGAGDPQRERRDIKARQIIFYFNEQGKVRQIQGQKDVEMTIDVEGSPELPKRTGKCGSFTAEINPETGDVQSAEFNRDVLFTRGAQRAAAQKASYTAESGLLGLRQLPELEDTEQGSALSAESIDLETRSGGIVARHTVRNVLRGGGKEGKGAKQKKKGGLLGGSDEPSVLTCAWFEKDSKTQISNCHGGAVLRKGKDEIRAPLLSVYEDANGHQHLHAEPGTSHDCDAPAGACGVSSFFFPNQKPGEKPRERVTADAGEMLYDESKNEIVYSRNVRITQGDIASVSPEATVTLMGDTSEMQAIVVGEPVSVRKGERRAEGTRGTYDPATETLTLTGDHLRVWCCDTSDRLKPAVASPGAFASPRPPGEEIHGRSLTFRAGDATLLIDGREQVRTEAVLRREPPKQ